MKEQKRYLFDAQHPPPDGRAVIELLTLLDIAAEPRKTIWSRGTSLIPLSIFVSHFLSAPVEQEVFEMPGRMKMSTFGLFFFFSNSFTRLFHEISVELLLFSICLGNYLYFSISIPRNKYIPTAAQAPLRSIAVNICILSISHHRSYWGINRIGCCIVWNV